MAQTGDLFEWNDADEFSERRRQGMIRSQASACFWHLLEPLLNGSAHDWSNSPFRD